MSNTLYYARRAVGLCPDCGVSVASGVYCQHDRDRRMAKIRADRAIDRVGYNQYMRVKFPRANRGTRKLNLAISERP